MIAFGSQAHLREGNGVGIEPRGCNEERRGQQSKTEKTGGDTKEQVYWMQGLGTSGRDKKPQRRSLSGKSCYRFVLHLPSS